MVQTRLLVMTLLWGIGLMASLIGCAGGGGDSSGGGDSDGQSPGTSVRAIPIGNGPIPQAPIALAVEPDGQILAVDIVLGAVLRVDPVTGDRTVVSNDTVGLGPHFDHPKGIEVEPNGQILVTDGLVGAQSAKGVVLRVDPVTGDRTVVWDASADNNYPLLEMGSIAIEADGRWVVTEPNLSAVLRIDPVTGDRTVVTGCLNARAADIPSPKAACPSVVSGDGPLSNVIPFIQFITVESDGNLLVSGWEQTVLRVDPVTGNRTVVTGCTHAGFNRDHEFLGCAGEIIGEGPLPKHIGPIAVEAEGQLVMWVVDNAQSGILRVDPGTGDRTVVWDITDSGLRMPWPGVGMGFSGIVVEANGSLTLSGGWQELDEFYIEWPTIIRVDLVTGDYTVISGFNLREDTPITIDPPPPDDNSPPPDDNSPPPDDNPPPPDDNPPPPDDDGGSESEFRLRPFGPLVQTE